MKNIVLIGMSGVGKSEKGRFLAERLGWNFIDTDDLIVERKKSTIDDIFNKYGEEYFRDIESEVIKEVSQLSNTIISTGGGIILKANNIEHLRKNGYIFLFMGKIQTIVDNIIQSQVIRPLLKDSIDLYDKVERLYKSREDLYLSSSDIIVSIDDKSIYEISDEILREYKQLNPNLF